MKKMHWLLLILFLFLTSPSHAGFLSAIIKTVIKVSDNVVPNASKVITAEPYMVPWVASRVARDKLICKTYKREVNTNEAYIYEDMNTNSNIIGKLDFKEKACISESKNEWFKTRYGWVLTSNFKLKPER